MSAVTRERALIFGTAWALCLPAFGEEAKEGIRKLIIRAVEAGARPVAYVEMFGNPARGKVISAAEEGLELEILGQTVSSPWEAFAARRLLGLASSCADENSAADLMTLARYAWSAEMKKAAVEYARRASALDPRFRGELEGMEKELRVAEAADVERRAEAAWKRIEKFAAEGSGERLAPALGSFERNNRSTWLGE